MEVTVTGGAEDLERLARRLRAAGTQGKGLRKELGKRMREAAKPLRGKAKENARRVLPQRGGLAARVAASRMSVSVTTGRTVGVKIVGRHGYDIRTMDAGTVRHPLFGNRTRFYSQRVSSGWFSDAIEREAPAMRRAAGQAMQDIANQIER